MIAIECIEDLLDADRARRDVGVEPIFTDSGRAILDSYLREMRKLRLTQVPAQDIAGVILPFRKQA